MVDPELAHLLDQAGIGADIEEEIDQLQADLDQAESDIDTLQQQVANLASGGTVFGDDEKLLFGDDQDFSMRYDSSIDAFEFLNERNSFSIFRVIDSLAEGVDLTLERGNIRLRRDGSKVIYGAGDDMSSRYVGGTDDLTWRDENNSADRMSLDRTTGDFRVTGEITEGASI